MNDIRYDGEIPLGEIHIIEETNRNFKLSSKVLEPEEMLSVLLAATKKVYSDFLGYENNGPILSKEGKIVFDLLEKINKYKSIGREIGCPLEVVFKAIKQGITGENGIEYDGDSLNLHYSDKQGWILYPIVCEYDEAEAFLLKDYKITWWLKEDRRDRSE